MPTIQYSESPNVETAFVVQDGGQKNRAVLTAPQDTSTLELPANPNSTKGYVTIDGQKHRVVLTADLLGNGGGGSVDYSKVVSKTKTMPVASADNANIIYLYDGTTNATYTHGYIYENEKTAIYTDSVTFEPATLSGTVVAATAGALSNLCAEYITGDITSIVSGTLVYLAAGDLWLLTGKDAEDNTVGSFQVYTPDYEAAGFTFTGTPEDGDVVAFTCTIEEDTVTYSWVQINTQPVPTAAEIGAVTQTVRTVSLVSTDWSSHSQTKTVTGVTADNTVIVAPAPASAADYTAAEILCTAQAANSLTFTCTTDPMNNVSVNVVILN